MPCHACQFTDASQSSRRVRSDRSFVRMQFMGLVSSKYKEIEMDSEIYKLIMIILYSGMITRVRA